MTDRTRLVRSPAPSTVAEPPGALRHRVATLDDVEAVLALWALAAENEDRPADSRADVERLIVRDPDALVLAVVDGAVVGTVVAGFDGWRCHLYRLVVDPAHRRRGVAAGLPAAAALAALGQDPGRGPVGILKPHSSHCGCASVMVVPSARCRS